MSQQQASQQSKEYLNKAIYYHSKHLEIGPDPGGHFVAHTNLGLCVGIKFGSSQLKCSFSCLQLKSIKEKSMKEPKETIRVM